MSVFWPNVWLNDQIQGEQMLPLAPTPDAHADIEFKSTGSWSNVAYGQSEKDENFNILVTITLEGQDHDPKSLKSNI